MQLRLGIARRAFHDQSDLVVLVPEHIVENQHLLVPMRHLTENMFQTFSVKQAAEGWVRSTQYLSRHAGFFLIFAVGL
jgi:hypothetical protein